MKSLSGIAAKKHEAWLVRPTAQASNIGTGTSMIAHNPTLATQIETISSWIWQYRVRIPAPRGLNLPETAEPFSLIGRVDDLNHKKLDNAELETSASFPMG